MRQIACFRHAIKALRVTLFADLQVRTHMDFAKPLGADNLSGHGAVIATGRN